MSAADDRPGVIAPPPILYLTALVAGVVAHLFLPWTLPVPTLMRWVGGALMVVALALGITARGMFTRAGTNVNPYQPAVALVTSGPFRFSRNPMYVALTTLYLGLILLTRIGWLMLLLVPLLLIMHLGVVLREESYLGKKFGADYETYRGRVRRYF